MKVDLFLKSNSEPCNEIKMLCGFENGIVFIDLGARKVKFQAEVFLSLLEKTVKILVGSGEEGTSDGIDQTCSFQSGSRGLFIG